MTEQTCDTKTQERGIAELQCTRYDQWSICGNRKKKAAALKTVSGVGGKQELTDTDAAQERLIRKTETCFIHVNYSPSCMRVCRTSHTGTSASTPLQLLHHDLNLGCQGTLEPNLGCERLFCGSIAIIKKKCELLERRGVEELPSSLICFYQKCC